MAGPPVQRWLRVNWTIRPAALQDLGCLVSIDRQSNENPWTEQQFLPGCDQRNRFEESLLVENIELVAGFVVYSYLLDEGSIYNIAVLPREQRQGLAGGLLKSAMAAMVERGVTRCLLEVRVSNVAARGLYEEAGFRQDGTRKNYYRSGDGREDAILMSRLL